MKQIKLKRSITFPVLFLYGLGTMVGGGFYALSGKVAGEAGMAAPLAFLLAGSLAFVNVFTFSELASRYPVSAGEARYVQEAFGRKWFAGLVGWLVILTGVVSAATLSVATISFLQEIVSLAEAVGVTLLILIMGAICAWGIGESVRTVLIITVIEVGALCYILLSKGSHLERLPELWEAGQSHFAGGFPLAGILSGAFLSFYAFIGFEDMVNMAEEVKKVRKTLPKAMIWAVVVTTLLYVLVSSTMVFTVAPQELAAANAPLERIIRGDGEAVSLFFIVISMLTGVNGALVQLVMASRVVYGLGREGLAPPALALINPKTQTPVRATLLVTFITLVLALAFRLISLAEATSFIILVLFAVLNVALIKIKRSPVAIHKKARTFPLWITILALLSCLGMLSFKIFH